MKEMNTLKGEQIPYEQNYYPPVPSGFTKMMRTFFIWQIYRFVVINIKMIIIILKSHK